MQEVDTLIAAIRTASYKEREPFKQQLLALARGPNGPAVREHIEAAKRGELLEVQWDLEEIIDATAPKVTTPPPAAAPPAPEPEPAAPAPEEKGALTAKDLVLMYDDPRGLMLHKAKVGERWFATQFDPRTGQPQTFELHEQEIQQLRTQLAGSPYWVIGGTPPSPVAAPAAKVGPR